ncbi:MAG: ADP-ribosylglycohydrolase family protein [Traorella sp.]
MNYYKNGIMGFVVGDALGVPYEFSYRYLLKEKPCVDMIGHGTYNLEEGCWSDDSSMTLATLDSLNKGYDPIDMMEKFIQWYKKYEYTPFGDLFDIGITTATALDHYLENKDITTCGLTKESQNGNGSLMRILPLCIYLYKNAYPPKQAISMIHEVSALTHAHMQSKMACGFYYFIACEIMKHENDLKQCIQIGISQAFNYYENEPLDVFQRIKDITSFQELSEDEIKSGGYVIDSLETSIWCLCNSDDYASAVLKAVNLGADTDTNAAITGGLAGLYYGYDNIPTSWLSKIKRRFFR